MHLHLGCSGGILVKEYSTVSQPQLPKAFKHTLQPVSQQYLPLKKFEGLHHVYHVSFLLNLSKLCLQTQGQRASSAVELFSTGLCMAFMCVWIRARQLVSSLPETESTWTQGREGKSNTLILLHFCLVYTNLASTCSFLHS